MSSRISVRLDDDQLAQLDAMGRSRSDSVRSLLKARTERVLPFREYGTSGLSRFGGSVHEEQLRELRGKAGRAIYAQMRMYPVVNAVLFAIEMSLRQVRWYAEAVSDSPEDREAAEHLDECLDDMSFSWSDELSFILVMLEQGFSLLELVYKKRDGRSPRKTAGNPNPAESKYSDGRIGWRKWAPRPPDSLAAGNEWIWDEAGGIQGVNQMGPPKYKLLPIPMEKLLLFRTTPAPANNPEGVSLERGMYMPWYYATQIQQIEGIGVERDLAGLPVAYLGSDLKLEGTDNDYDLAKKLVTNVRRDEQEGVVIPHPKMGMAGDGQGFLFELLSATGGRQFDTNEIINRYDKRIALRGLSQFLMLGMEQVGSYSLSRHHGDLYMLMVEAWAAGIAATINRYAVPRLFALNTFRVEQPPLLGHSAVGVPDLEGMAKYVNALVGSEVLTPDEDLENYLREMAQLPAKQNQIDISEPQVPDTDEDEDDLVDGLTDDMPDDEDVAKESLVKLAREKWRGGSYAGWLSDSALTLAGVAKDDRVGVLQGCMLELADQSGKDLPPLDFDAMDLQGEYMAKDSVLTAVARKLYAVTKQDEPTVQDYLLAGTSLLRRIRKGD